MRIEGQRDMTNPIAAFRSFAKTLETGLCWVLAGTSGDLNLLSYAHM